MIASAPDISVIIPVHNCKLYIETAIASVLSQQNCSFELIVIDDGSTDGTAQAIQPYAQNLRYIRQQNQGVSAARNHGIQVARGRFIAFLDADDYYLPNKLANQLQVFQTYPDTGLVHSGWQRVNAQGQHLTEVKPWEDYPVLDLNTWLQFKPVLPSAMMFRRDQLLQVGGFDPRFAAAEDVDLVLRLAIAGCQSRWLTQITTAYRQHGSSAMGNGLVQAQCLAQLLDKTFNHPNLPVAARLIEKRIRYGTLTWAAWYLYRTGHPSAMVNYLQQAYGFSHRSPLATLMDWAECFAQFSAACQDPLDLDALLQGQAWQSLSRWLLAQGQYFPDVQAPTAPIDRPRPERIPQLLATVGDTYSRR